MTLFDVSLTPMVAFALQHEHWAFRRVEKPDQEGKRCQERMALSTALSITRDGGYEES